MNTPKRGFTLTEMLVVLAILAALAAVLFPVLALVRENGRRTTCQSNLKQIGLAMQQYVQDNDHKYFPPLNAIFEPYPLLPYVRDSRVFLCPDQTQQDRMWLTGEIKISYGYDYPRLITRASDDKPWTPVSDAEIARPSALWLYQDSTQLFWRKLPAPCAHPVVGSTLHSGGGSYLFADGHVQWLTPEDFAAVTCTNGPLPPPWKVEAGI